jgi:hypothetical protein
LTREQEASVADSVFRKLTPVLMVEAIEPCLPLWTERLGWEQTVAVPEGDRIGFVILQKDGLEVMYQTWASVEKDMGITRERPRSTSAVLFIEVADLADIERRLRGVPITLPRRRTFYGMDEVGVTEAGGHLVVFAQPVAESGN